MTDAWPLDDGPGVYTFSLRVGDGPDGEAPQTVTLPQDCGQGAVGAEASASDAYCVDGGAAVDVTVNTTPATAGIEMDVTSIRDGVYTQFGGPTGADGTYTATVPIPTDGWTTVQANYPLAAGAFVPLGDWGYEFPSECLPGPSPTPTPTSTGMPAPSGTTDSAASLSATNVVPGGQVTVTASGLAANESVQIWLHSTPITLWSGTANADGTLSQRVTIPAGTEIGKHQIEVRGATTGSLWLNLTVSERLAETGFDSVASVGIGVGASVLLVAGAGFLTAALVRRRRAA